MARFCDLPEKTVVEIMLLLPPKTLSRLKCVQKSWYVLINTLTKSPWFVTKHLKNSESHSSSLFRRIRPVRSVNHYYHHEPPTNSFLTFEEANDAKNRRVCFNTEVFNAPESIAGVRGSHCNGILFLPDEETDKVLLCNPTIREFKLLQGSCFGSNFRTPIMVGFGYDAIANVYKIVRVVSLHTAHVGAPPIAAEICTLGNNHGDAWREIKMNVEIDSTFHTFDEVYHRGVYYWVIREPIQLKQMLVAFNMHEEEFQTIPFPQDPDHQKFEVPSRNTFINWKLGLENEHVALFSYIGFIARPVPAPGAEFKTIKMWILDEISSSRRKTASSCWIKCADLLLDMKLCYYPFVFWKRDELLLHKPQMGVSFVSYNFRTQKLRDVQVNNFDPQRMYNDFRAFVYVESLVSLAGARRMI